MPASLKLLSTLLIFAGLVTVAPCRAEMNPNMDSVIQQLMQKKAQEDAQKQREEEFKNPKKASLGKGTVVRGSLAAPVTIVEYSDFQCPFCRKGFLTVEEVRKKYGNKVAVVFKNMPLPMHPMAMPAAQRFAAIALQSPKKAFLFHDEVFTNQNQMGGPDGEKFLDEAAKKAGANIDKMHKDMTSDKVKAHIDADIEEAKKFGFTGTPGFLVAGVSIRGAYPAEVFSEIIDKRLKEKKQ